MTAAMAALGFGSDQVAGDDLAFQSLYFIGVVAVRHDARCSTSSATGSSPRRGRCY